MSSTNGSGRPSGCISIPVEIIRDSTPNNAGSHSRHNSPFRTLPNENPYGGFSDSPPWNSSMTANPNSRFQPRQSPSTAYDRVITNSQFNQPLNDRPSYQAFQDGQVRQPQQRMPEPALSHFSRSNEDLLSAPFESMRYSAQPQYTSLIPPAFAGGFRPESDFLQSSKYTSPLRRSFDALNDFPDMHQSFPMPRQYPAEQPQQQQQQQPYYRSTYQTQHQPQSQQQQYQQQQQPTHANQTFYNPNIVYLNEFGIPTDQYQPNTFQEKGQFSNDRSRSPGPQRGASPARPSPSPATQQQQEEPELKMAKDSAGPIPMPPPASASTSTDQQVPSADASVPNSAPAPPPAPELVRDPNTIALEKLEQIKEMLADLDQQVEAFTGSNRHDRSYKLLDEQALKIMIRCDELVDVSADIKEKRKEMIRNVERVIGKLESKVPATPAVESNSNPMESSAPTPTSSLDGYPDAGEHQHSKKKPSPSPPKESLPTPATEQSAST